MDLKNGHELWQSPVPADDETGFGPDPVAAGGGLAVLADKGLRAVDVRTGASRWTAAVVEHCLPGGAAPAERHVAALLACGDPDKPWSDGAPADAELYAAAFAPTTGALLWSAPFGDREPVSRSVDTSVLSADPLVVSVTTTPGSTSTSLSSAYGSYYSFGEDGSPNPPIDYDGDYGKLESEGPLGAATDGTRLYALAGYYMKGVARHRAVAFDLATGRQVWSAGLDDLPGVGLHLRGGKVTVIARGSATSPVPDEDLYVFDAATGKERDVRDFHDDVPADRIFEYRDLLIVVGPDASFTAYERS
ncbi:PQQ-binding-like beta-propeller repeat protein [Streptomyces pharetrae]|uniref:outer membrane protein assembly factor BamB family protein n=1 Tax=Streptomyces pharetrae TaxID=291370 RepID=UPI00365C1B9C